MAQRGQQLGKRRSTGLVILLTIVTCGVWAIVSSFQNGDELQRWSGKGIGGVGYLLITVFISPVTMFLLAGEVEQLYRDERARATDHDHLGSVVPAPTDRQPDLVHPYPGTAINSYWTAHGQTNDPGL